MTSKLGDEVSHIRGLLFVFKEKSGVGTVNFLSFFLSFLISPVHHRFNAHELWQNLGDGEAQGSLVYCSPWGPEELDMAWQMNNKNLVHFRVVIFKIHEQK